MICDLRSDHSFDHLQGWTTWELWTLRYKKARFSGKKAPKTTQNEAKDGYCFLWELDAAGSSPVTSTKPATLLFMHVLRRNGYEKICMCCVELMDGFRVVLV